MTAPHADATRGPLDGIRVVDLTVAYAGPFATRILADLGADVIHVDTRVNRQYETNLDFVGRLIGVYPNADPGAEPWNAGGVYNQTFRNKRSIELDLGTDDGREELLRLVESADCLVENFTPKVMRGLRLAYDQLVEVNPALVYVALPGYGSTGPHSEFPAYAPTTEASSGFSSLVGYEDGTYVPNPNNTADFVGGLSGATGLMAALWAARRTGRGAFVDLSQIEAMASFVGEEFGARETDDLPVQPTGNRLAGAVVSGIYPCRGFDEWVAIAIESPEQLDALVALGAVDSAEMDTDHLHRALHEWSRRFGKHEAAAMLQAVGVPAAAVQRGADLLADPQLNELGFFVTLQGPGCPAYPYDGVPWHYDVWPRLPLGPAPRRGEHTSEVMSEVEDRRAMRPG